MSDLLLRITFSLIGFIAPLVAQQDLQRVAPLLEQVAAKLRSGDFDAARLRLAEALDLLDRQDAEFRDDDAVKLRWQCGEAASFDPALGKRAWSGVIKYYERGGERVLADPQPRGWLQQARDELAKAHAMHQEFADELRLRREILATWEKVGAKFEPLTAMALLGRALVRNQQDSAARECLTKALDQLERIDQDCRDRDAVACRWQCGDAAWEFDLDLGKRAWTGVVRHYERGNVQELAGQGQLVFLQQARGFLAAVHAKRAEHDDAVQVNRAIVRDWDAVAARVEAAVARAELGQALILCSAAQEAEGLGELEKACASLRVERPGSPELARVARMFANSLIDAGQDLDPRVSELQETALAIYRQQPPPQLKDLVDLEWEMANILHGAGDHLRARMLAQESFETAVRKFGADSLDTTYPRGNYARLLSELGELDTADALYRKNLAIRTSRLPPGHDDIVMVQLNLGFNLMQLHRREKYLEAIPLFEDAIRSLANAKSSFLLTNRTYLLDNLGNCYAETGQPEKAVARLEQALASDLPPVARAQVQGGMAMALQRAGRLEQAAAMFDKAIPLVVKTQHARQPVRYLGRQAQTLAALNDGKRLQQCLETLLGVADRTLGECYALPGRPSYELAKIVDRAAQTVLALAKGTGDKEALERRAFEILESLRGIELRVTKLATQLSKNPALARQQQAAREARGKLARLGSLGEGSQGDILDAAIERDKHEFTLLYQAMAGAGMPPIRVTVDAIAKALPKGAAAVAFRTVSLVLPDPDKKGAEKNAESCEAFVVTRGTDGKGRLARVPLGPPEPIRKAADAWRDSILHGEVRGRSPKEDKERPDPAAPLAAKVIQPIKQQLGGAKILIACLDDKLHQVPIEVIDEGLEWRFTVSLADLVAAPPGKLAPESLFAIGGVDFAHLPGSDQDAPTAASAQRDDAMRGAPSPIWGSGAKIAGKTWPLLQGTDEEVDSIAGAFHARFAQQPSVVKKGREVAREVVLAEAQRARFLHFATHGYFLDVEAGDASERDRVLRGYAPMSLCGLTLTGASLTGTNGFMGVITGEEIAGLDLSGCELAVMSACETYLGESRAGHGLASLQGAMHAAGARAVIATRWQVPNGPAKRLMEQFYANLWQTNCKPREALAYAKEQLRKSKDFQRVEDWAGFILTGDLKD